MFRYFAALFSVLTLAWGSSARADFSSCVDHIKSDAARIGVTSQTLDEAFAGLKPDLKVLDLENFQPEFKTPIWDYLAGLVDDERVEDGKAAMVTNASALAMAEHRFGVSRYIIAAIWGLESDFGRAMGDRPLIQSLTTLACTHSRRPQYFRGELLSTLKIAENGDIPLEKLKGSWAGAFGQTQFMPSTFLRLAVDLDGTGRNIVDNPAAAIGSTANYLQKSGWRTGESWGFEVKLPPGYTGPSGRKNRRPMSFWVARGISRVDGQNLADGDAGLLLPVGVNGPAFLVMHNFDIIYSYNAAESYTLAAAILAQRLAGGPDIATPWPTDDPGTFTIGPPPAPTATDQARLRCGIPRRRRWREDEGRYLRFRKEKWYGSEWASVCEGSRGASTITLQHQIALRYLRLAILNVCRFS